MSDFLQNLLSGIIGGTFVYIIQMFRESVKEKKTHRENNKLGKSNEKYIAEEFLNIYCPGNISIQKIIQDFGQPIHKYQSPIFNKNGEHINEVMIYEYKFTNAVILFSTFINQSSIISLTINSTFDKHPIKFPFTFKKKDQYLGKAKVNKYMLENKIHFENRVYTNWVYSALQSKYFNRQIKYLTFTYIACYPNVNNENDMLKKLIDQLCISTDENVYPVINFYEMI
jgi:hypothetical protein